jgi:hypothetical protein
MLAMELIMATIRRRVGGGTGPAQKFSIFPKTIQLFTPYRRKWMRLNRSMLDRKKHLLVPTLPRGNAIPRRSGVEAVRSISFAFLPQSTLTR